MSSADMDAMTRKLVKRYRSAYFVAKVIIITGLIVQIIGVLFAFIPLLFSTLGTINTFNGGGRNMPSEFNMAAGTSQLPGTIYVLVVAIVTLIFFYVVGIVIKALGQMLRATLDTAVHTSPLLDLDAKVAAMGI